MCDLWRYTIEEDTPPGAIPSQVAAARQQLAAGREPVSHMKLYNAGSFFDPRAVPAADYGGVARAVAGLRRVIVESHPSLVGPRVGRFLEALAREADPGTPPAALEVAMGLETAHPEALDRMNKRMTLDLFAAAADRLAALRVAVRAFVLIFPPFVRAKEQDDWLVRSIEYAFACGASVVSLIPTRPGNGALEALAADGQFRAPTLADVERSTDLAHAHLPGRGRIFIDLWDFDRLAGCAGCAAARRERLHRMNLEQRLAPAVRCPRCGAGTARALPLAFRHPS
jgi:radical SAM enzyme (TIGR01210 family)